MVWSKAFGNNIVCVIQKLHTYHPFSVSCNFFRCCNMHFNKTALFFSTNTVKTAVLTPFSKPKLIRKPWFFTKYKLEPNTVTGIERKNCDSTNTNSVTVQHWSVTRKWTERSQNRLKRTSTRRLYLQSWHRWRLRSSRRLWHGGKTRLCTCSDSICLETQSQHDNFAAKCPKTQAPVFLLVKYKISRCAKNGTKSQAVARIADRTAKNCSSYVT